MRRIHQATLTAIDHLRPNFRTLLDLGCADGSFTQEIARRFPYASIVGIDPNLSVLQKGDTSPLFVAGNAEQLPFSSQSFEIVVACLSFHHFTFKQTAMTEAARVLVPGGLFIIADPFFEGILSRKPLAWLLQKTDSGTFTRTEELEHFAENAKLTIGRTWTVPCSSGALLVVYLRK